MNLCIKYKSLIISNDIERKPVLQVEKKNVIIFGGFLHKSNFDIYFIILYIIIYPCINYEFNALMFSKDIALKPFFKVKKKKNKKKT